MGKKPGLNPYLPSWEYIPDGEPHVFEGRVYVYGSHDRFNGYAYCLNDYVCWSAPVEDLTDWRYEGVIYTRGDDPLNPDGDMCLFAPDVTRGPDGRYYLFYVLNRTNVLSVAVCDTPAGRYRFHGHVYHPDGTLLGDKPGDGSNFDPGVFAENGLVYVYTGFCWGNVQQPDGSRVTVLEPDMLTVRHREEAFIAPNRFASAGTGFEGHAFFEASSLRRRGDTYYYIYSSVLSHELCYATSKSPLGGFVYGGVIVSNNDSYIESYKPAERTMFYGGNNHGSLVEIGGRWYVFYHRHTNGTNYSRQGCIEPITFREDGSILQAEMTSCGCNGGPLPGRGEYPAYAACQLYCPTPAAMTAAPGDWMDCRFPKITQDGCDGQETPGYIANLREGATAGFKYFDCQGTRLTGVRVRGSHGELEVRLSHDGPVIGRIALPGNTEWRKHPAEIALPDGVHALYFTYRGPGPLSMLSLILE